MKEYKSQSTEMPKEWDLTSSGTTVYHNFNVEILPLTEGTPQMYNYDVIEYTKAEYETLALEKQRSDIDFIATMSSIDLGV